MEESETQRNLRNMEDGLANIKSILREVQSGQRQLAPWLTQTPSSFSPYVRKTHSTRKVQPNTQVPKTPHISTPVLPAWKPPHPTPSPDPQSSPMDQTTPPPVLPTQSQTSSPPPLTQSIPPLTPLPTTSQTQPQQIPSLMSITFTPHTILRFKSRLQQRHRTTFHPERHQRHTPISHTPQSLPYTLPLLPLLHTLTHLLHTIQYIVFQTYPVPAHNYLNYP